MLTRTMTAATLILALGLPSTASVAEDVWDDRGGVLMHDGTGSAGPSLGNGERRLSVPAGEMIPEGGIRGEEDEGVATTDDRDVNGDRSNGEGVGTESRSDEDERIGLDRDMWQVQPR